MKNVDFNQILPQFNEKLANGGIFLTVNGEKANTMTIGWAQAGHMWQKNIVTVLVRPQRYTYELIEKADEFTVSIPTRNTLKAELAFAGSKSGRDFDKFEGHGLTAVKGQTMETPVVGECGLHLECRILHRQVLTDDIRDKDGYAKMYPMKDYHIMYYGEVVACYSTDE